MSDADFSIGYEQDAGVAQITLERAAKHNALTIAMTQALRSALERFDRDPLAQVAVLSGAGKSFCAGADLAESQMASVEDMRAARDQMSLGHPFFELFSGLPHAKPVIAALHGNVLGLGLALALNCDLIVAEDNARLQVTETGRGLGGYRHWALMRARGVGAWGDDVCLSGRFFTAAEALNAGLFTQIAPEGEGREQALTLARSLAILPPLSLRETNRIRRWHVSKLVREIAFETENLRLELSEDFNEVITAMKEKRAPGPFQAR